MKPIPDSIRTADVWLDRVPLRGDHGDAYNGAAVIVRPQINKREAFAAIFSTGLGWEHVSISLRTRTPSWDEMCVMREIFFAPDEWVVQFHPPVDQYVNNHEHCLHLWRSLDAPQPVPQSILVGVRDASRAEIDEWVKRS